MIMMAMENAGIGPRKKFLQMAYNEDAGGRETQALKAVEILMSMNEQCKRKALEPEVKSETECA